jgi:hypothetical protein
MLRAAFFATGLFTCFLGTELWFIESMVVAMPDAAAAKPRQAAVDEELFAARERAQLTLRPAGWMGASLLMFGGVTMIYAIGLPRLSVRIPAEISESAPTESAAGHVLFFHAPTRAYHDAA